MTSRDGGPVMDPARVEPADDPAGTAGPTGPSRRRLLTGAGLFGAGAVAGGLTGYFTSSATESSGAGDTSLGQQTIPFYGAHQAGIITPAQDRLAFGTMNVVSGTSHADLRDLLRVWTGAAARMAAGQLVGEESDPSAPPVDTGEAAGAPVSRLTVTIGYGPGLFDDRFGLAARKPAALTDLPPLPNENLDPDYTGGDLCVQACADNPLVAFHAVRNLARIGMGVVTHNWMELGFGRTSTTSTAQATPRNLLGFKDGTRNIKAEQTELLNQHVWVGQETDQPRRRGVQHARLRQGGRRRAARHPRRRPHPAGQPRAQRRNPYPAPRLLLHRRHRPAGRDPARRPVLHRVHEEPIPVRQAPDGAGGRRPERVHPPHRQRRV